MLNTRESVRDLIRKATVAGPGFALYTVTHIRCWSCGAKFAKNQHAKINAHRIECATLKAAQGTRR